MKKFSKEQEAYFEEKIAEAEESIKQYGTFPIEEFWKNLHKLEEEERRQKQLKRKSLRLNIIRPFGKITKKFIRARWSFY